MEQLDNKQLTLKDYHDFVLSTALPSVDKNKLVYPALGLSEEAGEVAGKIKKFLRGDGELDKQSVIKELGDVLWYTAKMAYDLGYTIEDVAKINIEKISLRKKTNTLKGSGDNREEVINAS